MKVIEIRKSATTGTETPAEDIPAAPMVAAGNIPTAFWQGQAVSLLSNPAVAAEVASLQKFLSVNRARLDVATTNSLLATYGLMDALLHYARERNDH